MKKFVLTILCMLALAMPAAADDWQLDANHSKLKFAIDARMIGAEGIFRKWAVKADINEQALEQSKIEMTIDMSSIDTNSDRRDTHLKSPDFFDVAKYPEGKIAVK